MAYKNLNIPATLVHAVDGKKYTLNGKLLSIDESTKTCTMRFGKEVAKNVPLNEVYLNEAFLDDVKALGKKAVEKAKHFWHKITDVVKTVAGFILPVNEDGEEIEEFANIPANIACVELPDSICYAPGQATLEVCEEMGAKPIQKYDADTVFSKAESDEKSEIETYWTRVMQDYGESDRTIEESVHYVNENFYHTSAPAKALNEYVVSLDNVALDIYGPTKNTAQLVDIVTSSLMHQLNPVSDEDARAVLVWGAPGIGKTAIIKQAAKRIRAEYKLNFDTAVVCCGGLKQDDFELPDTIKNAFGDKQTISVPKTWLPVFKHNGLTDDEIAQMDEYYNSGAFLKRIKGEGFAGRKVETEGGKQDMLSLDKNSKDEKFDGGIIFFDEFARLRNLKTMDTMLTICGDRRYMDMELASHWVQVAAANRLTDDMKSESDPDFWGVWDQAKFQRFYQYTFVPTKKEWIEWARDIDDEGYQNVDELIVAFIEKAPDGVWYDAIDLKSRDKEYFDNSTDAEDKKFRKAVDSIGDGTISNEEIKTIGSYISHAGKSLLNLKKNTWSGRTWDAMIAKKMLSVLKNELFYGEPEKYAACFAESTRTKETDGGLHTTTYQAKNLSMPNLEKQLNGIDDVKWYTWTKGKYQDFDKDEKLRKTDRLGFFIAYVGQLISDTMGAKSLPAEEWNKSRKTGSVMNETNIRFLWTQGRFKLVQDQKADDILYPTQGEYSSNVVTGWKADPSLVDQVCQEIWNEFDAYCPDALLKKDIKNMQRAYQNAPEISQAIINKWDKQYTINMVNAVNNKPKVINVLYGNAGESGDELEYKKQIAFLLEYSEIARRLANIALYFAKITYQIQSNQPVVYLLGDASDPTRNGDETLENKCILKWSKVKEFSDFVKTYQQGLPWLPAKAILNAIKAFGEE